MDYFPILIETHQSVLSSSGTAKVSNPPTDRLFHPSYAAAISGTLNLLKSTNITRSTRVFENLSTANLARRAKWIKLYISRAYI